MSQQTKVMVPPQKAPLLSQIKSLLLQRECACGGSPGIDGLCNECQEKRLTSPSSRRGFEAPSASAVAQGNSPAQGNVSSSSAVVDRASHFGHDFSRIPIHSTQAAAPQTQLKINQPGDVYEQEADQVAEQVMRMTDSGNPMSDDEDEDEAKNSLMRKQSRESRAHAATGFPDVPPVVHTVLSSGGGEPLDTTTRGFMEPRFEHNFSHVRVHTDATAANAASRWNARAFTLDQHIYFGDPYEPSSPFGEALLAHELTHVIQANAAASNPLQPSNSVDALEREARYVTTEFRLGTALPPIRGLARNLAVPLRAGPDDPGVPTFGNLPGDQPISGARRLKLEKIDGKWYEILPGREQYKRRAAGWYDFVVQDGEIRAVKARSRFGLTPYGHTEAARGQRVELAGQIHFTSHSGQISEWNAASGHYRNSEVFAKQIGEQVGLPVANYKPHPERSSVVQLPTYQPKKDEILVPSGTGGGVKRADSPTEIGSESPPIGPKPAGGTTAQKSTGTTITPKNEAPEPPTLPKTTSPKISAPIEDQPSSPVRGQGGVQEGRAEMQATARSIIESIEADFKVLRIAKALTVSMHILDLFFTLSTLNEFVSSARSALEGKGFLLTKEIEHAKRFKEGAAESLASYHTYSDLLQTKSQQLFRVLDSKDPIGAGRAFQAVSELELRLWGRESVLSERITKVESIISSLRLKQAAAKKILESPEASRALAMATFGTAELAHLAEIDVDLDTIDGELSQAVSSMEEMDKLLKSDARSLENWRGDLWTAARP